MDILIVVLIAHVVFGSLGLLSGTIIFFLKKGDNRHKVIGRVFAWSMYTSSIAAFILSLSNKLPFLLIISVFTLYMTYTGWRYLRIRKRIMFNKLKLKDWAVPAVMGAFSMALLVRALYALSVQNQFGWVMLFFSALSLMMVIQDLRVFSGKVDAKNFHQLMHIQRMIGAYIASITAFLVVNTSEKIELPFWVIWIGPTLIMMIPMTIWLRKYKVPLVQKNEDGVKEYSLPSTKDDED